MLGIIRQRTVSYGGLQVNRSGFPSLKHSKEINYLLDCGLIQRGTVPGALWWGYSHITRTVVTVRNLDASYLRRVTCPFCGVEVKHWADISGSLHEEPCMLRHESL